MAKGNYDNAAVFYDRLARMVFGDSLIKTQVYILGRIPANSKILIVGGGTGWILEEITKIDPAGLSITYVEISAKMMALSRKRNVGGNKVTFVTQAIQQAELNNDFDVVITPFLLDNFSDEHLPAIFEPIHKALKPSGLWLHADFQLTGKLWQNLMLKSMLLFFKALCGVESWQLPDAEGMFARQGYKKIEERDFYGRFVVSRVYRKSK